MADLDKMSLEELEALMLNPAAAEPEPPPPEPSEPDPTPPAAPTAEVPAAAAEPEPEPTEMSSEEVRLALDAAQAQAKHFEKIAGRNAGEVGFLKQQYDALASQLSALRAERHDDGSGYTPEPPALPRPESTRTDPIATWAVGTAINAAGAAFAQAHPDFADSQNEVMAYLKNSGLDAGNLLTLNDPAEAATRVTRALEEAHSYVVRERTEKALTDLRAKKVEQMAQRRVNIAKATISGSGSTPPPPTAAKSLDQMTEQELLAKMDGLYKQGR